MQGILRGLAYLHDEKNIIHRDLKTGNILIDSYKHLERAKIIDFGLAVHNVSGDLNDYERCGTLIYQPPEQAANTYNYGKKADIWAAGIIMYELLTGKHPFDMEGLPVDQFRTWIKNVKTFIYPEGVSELAKDLVSKLCCPKQFLRLKARQALQHPWITRQLDDPLPKNEYELSQDLFLKALLSDAMKAVYFISMCKSHNEGRSSFGARVISNSYELEIKKQSGEIVEEEKLSDQESLRETTVITKQTPQQEEEGNRTNQQIEKSFRVRTLKKGPRFPNCISQENFEETKKSKDFPQVKPYNASLIDDLHLGQRGQRVKYKKKLNVEKGSIKPRKRISKDKGKQNLEIPESSAQYGSYHNRKSSLHSSQISIGSPHEVRIMNEDEFSDIDLSIEDKNDKSNHTNIPTNTSNMNGKKMKTNNNMQKTNKSINIPKFPDIEKNPTMVAQNSNRLSQNEFLSKLREQRELRTGSQISNRFQMIENKSVKSFINESSKRKCNSQFEHRDERKKGQKTYRKIGGSTAYLIPLTSQKNSISTRKPVDTPSINLKTNLLTFEFAQHIKALTPVKPLNLWNKQ